MRELADKLAEIRAGVAQLERIAAIATCRGRSGAIYGGPAGAMWPAASGAVPRSTASVPGAAIETMATRPKPSSDKPGATTA